MDPKKDAEIVAGEHRAPEAGSSAFIWRRDGAAALGPSSVVSRHRSAAQLRQTAETTPSLPKQPPPSTFSQDLFGAIFFTRLPVFFFSFWHSFPGPLIPPNYRQYVATRIVRPAGNAYPPAVASRRPGTPFAHGPSSNNFFANMRGGPFFIGC